MITQLFQSALLDAFTTTIAPSVTSYMFLFTQGPISNEPVLVSEFTLPTQTGCLPKTLSSWGANYDSGGGSLARNGGPKSFTGDGTDTPETIIGWGICDVNPTPGPANVIIWALLPHGHTLDRVIDLLEIIPTINVDINGNFVEQTTIPA